jgi:hypothetical protein
LFGKEEISFFAIFTEIFGPKANISFLNPRFEELSLCACPLHKEIIKIIATKTMCLTFTFVCILIDLNVYFLCSLATFYSITAIKRYFCLKIEFF